MGEEANPQTESPEQMADVKSQRPAFQFGLRGMMLLTAAFCVMFASFKALGLSPFATLLVSSLLFLSLLGGLGLVLLIARSIRDDEDPR